MAKTMPDLDGDGVNGPENEDIDLVDPQSSVPDMAYKYDKNGNMRFSQDPNQRSEGTVGFATYDFAGRLLRTGEAAADYNNLDGLASTYTLENTESNWISVNQYDESPNSNVFPWNQFDLNPYLSALYNGTGKLTATAYKSGGSWQATLYSYDKFGRVYIKYILTDDVPYTRLAYFYNTLGQLIETRSTVGDDDFYHFYEYNALGQLEKVFTSESNTKPSNADVTYSYTPAGAVHERKLFQTGTSSFREAISFQYHIRDWIKSIGNMEDPGQSFSANFEYSLNGNINTAEFNNKNASTHPRYRYEMRYDPARRMLRADYAYYDNGWQNPSLPDAYDVTDIQYDKSGNITALKRNKEDGSIIDDLTYNYTSGTGNHLQSIGDASGISTESWDAEARVYSYDNNGNIKSYTENGVAKIANIDYDWRNLPILIVKGDGTQISYRYNAAGQRIYRLVSGKPAEHYIMDDFMVIGMYDGKMEYWNIYGNGLEGRSELLPVEPIMLPQTSSSIGIEAIIPPPPPEPAYEWNKFLYLKDHLGSVRAVMADDGSVKESYDFYPFGLKMPGRVFVSGTAFDKNLFTGKELDGETGDYYFGFRYYNPAIGKWNSVDALADFFPNESTYGYVGNNPMRLIDLFGLSGGEPDLPRQDDGPWWNDDPNYTLMGPGVIVTPEGSWLEWSWRWNFGYLDVSSNNSGTPYIRTYGGAGSGGSASNGNLKSQKRTLMDIFTGPLATPSDPGWYKFLHGTGDIVHDGKCFMVGVTVGSVAIPVLVYGGLEAGPFVAAELELVGGSGVVISDAVAGAYEIASIEHVALSNAARTQITATSVQAVSFYGAHSTGINNFVNGMWSAWGAETPVRGWGYVGYFWGYILGP